MSADMRGHWMPASTVPPMTTEKTFFDGVCSVPVLAIFNDDDDDPGSLNIQRAVYISYGVEYTPDGWHTFISGGGLDRCTSSGGKAPVAWVFLPEWLMKPNKDERE